METTMNTFDISQEALHNAQKRKLEYLEYKFDIYGVKNNFATYYTYQDISIIPTVLTSVSSRSQVDITETFYTVRGEHLNIVPIFGASMSFMRSKFARDLWQSDGGIHILPRVNLNDAERLEDIKNSEVPVGVAIGINESYKFIEKILDQDNLKLISLDIAHGANSAILNPLTMIRDFDVLNGVIIGNVGSLEGFLYALEIAKLLNFDDITIKVGIGPGSVCTTRVNTGVGLGQFSLIEEIYLYLDTFHDHTDDNDLLVSIIADGGINNSGDVAKALGRSHGVMMAKMLTSLSFESSVLQMNKNEEVSANIYGMASEYVQNKTNFIEGGSQIVNKVPTLDNVVRNIKDGLRSAMTYVDADNLERYRANIQYAVNSPGAIREMGVH